MGNIKQTLKLELEEIEAQIKHLEKADTELPKGSLFIRKFKYRGKVRERLCWQTRDKSGKCRQTVVKSGHEPNLKELQQRWVADHCLKDLYICEDKLKKFIDEYKEFNHDEVFMKLPGWRYPEDTSEAKSDRKQVDVSGSKLNRKQMDASGRRRKNSKKEAAAGDDWTEREEKESKNSEKHRNLEERIRTEHELFYGPSINEGRLKNSSELKMWESLVSYANSFHEEDRVHRSKDGIFRSKSEMLIASELSANGIAFKYDTILELENGRLISPDFVMIHPTENRLIYWEHFGAMDKAGYEDRTREKVFEYAENGITLWNNLIITFELPGQGLDLLTVDRIIRVFLTGAE